LDAAQLLAVWAGADLGVFMSSPAVRCGSRDPMLRRIGNSRNLSDDLLCGKSCLKQREVVLETTRSGLENGENLSFGNDVIEFDKNRFKFACGRRSDRDFHLHGFDECNVVAVADAAPDFYGKRADAPRHLGHNLDVWHSVLRDSRHAQS
jgi:hypothetical protein